MNNLLIFKALEFAAQRHSFQRRKGYDSIPYINHPIRVLRILAEYGVDDQDVLLAAILHDTIEDTDTTPDEIEQFFGKEVLKLVLEMTDDMTFSPEIRKALQIEKADKLDPRTKLIKIADKAANIHDISTLPLNWPMDRKTAYLDWAEKVVAKCRGGNEKLDAYFDRILREGRDFLSMKE
jgi:guanosine-3',5'-bis(diphosphate) 3'-pyrophosphohydrolase